MKIQSSSVTKLIVTDIKSLDPVAIYLEDYAKGQGKLIITCYDKSWTDYWGAMGDNDLASFVISCDNHYLAKKLNPDVKNTITDEDGLEDYARKYIIARRREDILDKNTARALYNDCDSLLIYRDTDYEAYSNLMYEIFGDEWWPKYEYFSRILDVVREALKEYKNEEANH